MSALITRHFIGLTGEGARFSISLGPGDPADLPASEPLQYGDRFMYPVSEDIALEWASEEMTDEGNEE